MTRGGSTAIAGNNMRSRWVIVGLAGVAASGALVVAAGAFQSKPTGPSARPWAPGIHAPVEAMNRLAPDPATPAEAVAEVRDFAERSGGSAASATLTLRTLRDDLGPRAGTIHAFSPDGLTVCLMHWRFGSTCPSAPSTPTPGLLFMVSGGYPAWARADGIAVPSALVGIAADNVRSVTFIEDGVARPAEIRNNAFYLPVKEGPADHPWDELRVEYDTGATASVRVPAGR